jgi:CRISPR-associated protein Cas1
VQLQLSSVVNEFKQRLTGTLSVRPHPAEDRIQPAVAPAPASSATTPRPKRPKRSTATSANPPTANVTEPTPAAPVDEPPACDPIPVVNGVAVVYGYGVKVSVVRSHLFVSDGICDERRACYLNRATSGLRHLVIISHRGSVSLDAVKWLHGLGASVSIIGDDGEVILHSSPLGADHPSLRRAQVLASLTDTGLAITRSLLMDKVKGQARVLRQLGSDDLADYLASTVVDTMEAVTTLDDARSLEARAADAYWQAWEHLPVNFARKDQARVPAHWHTFGHRQGQTGSAKNATTPGNAALNYLFAILETETRIACLAVGLDPGLGFLHSDKRDRDSLALDLMEVVRPSVEEWLLGFLRSRTFSRSDFAELDTGVVRISATLARELCRTAPLWRRLIASVAERVAQQVINVTRPGEVLPTRLTNTKRAIANRSRHVPNGPISTPDQPPPAVVESPRRDEPSGSSVASAPDAARSAAESQTARPGTDSAIPEQGSRLPRAVGPKVRKCRECGKPVPDGSRSNFCSATCADVHNREVYLVAAAAASQTPDAREKRSTANAERKNATLAWERAHPEVELAVERERFRRQILPRLVALTYKQIADALDCSDSFVKCIRKGKAQPHPMHFAALEALLNANSATALEVSR